MSYDFAGAINLVDLLAMLPDPGIAKRVFGFANRYHPPANAEHRAMVDDPEFVEVRSAARPGFWRSSAKSEKLADVGEEERIARRCFSFGRSRLRRHVYLRGVFTPLFFG